MTTTMTPTATNIPNVNANKPSATKPIAIKSNVSPSSSPKSITAPEKTNTDDMKAKKPAKVSWWKFWAKKPTEAKSAKASESNSSLMQKNKAEESKPSKPSVSANRGDISNAATNPSGRGGLNGINPTNSTTKAEVNTESAMLEMFKELKLSNDKLNETLTGIAEHLKASKSTDERVIVALQEVGQSVSKSVAQADRSFAESSSAIVASAEKSEQSIFKLNEHISKSSATFDEASKRIETNDQENRNNLEKLQKRSNSIILGLGITMTVAAVTFSVIQLVFG